MKWSGEIGFAELKEIEPGYVEDVITDKKYKGDLIRDTRRTQSSGNINDDIVISNQISILADPYITQNFLNIRYARWQGHRWKVTTVDVDYPRITLTLGGVWNGQQAETSSET